MVATTWVIRAFWVGGNMSTEMDLSVGIAYWSKAFMWGKQNWRLFTWQGSYGAHSQSREPGGLRTRYFVCSVILSAAQWESIFKCVNTHLESLSNSDKIAHLINRRASVWACFDLVQILSCDQRQLMNVNRSWNGELAKTVFALSRRGWRMGWSKERLEARSGVRVRAQAGARPSGSDGSRAVRHGCDVGQALKLLCAKIPSLEKWG